MKKKIKLTLIGIYGILYVITIFLMFFTTGGSQGNGAFKGAPVPWYLMIVISLIGILFLVPWSPVSKANAKLIMIFGTLLLLNLFLGLFSLLDILGTKNYAVTSTMFFITPSLTLVSEGLRK